MSYRPQALGWYEPTGVVQMAPGTVGSIWAGTARPYGGGLVLDGAVGYRPLPFVSFGAMSF